MNHEHRSGPGRREERPNQPPRSSVGTRGQPGKPGGVRRCLEARELSASPQAPMMDLSCRPAEAVCDDRVRPAEPAATPSSLPHGPRAGRDREQPAARRAAGRLPPGPARHLADLGTGPGALRHRDRHLAPYVHLLLEPAHFVMGRAASSSAFPSGPKPPALPLKASEWGSSHDASRVRKGSQAGSAGQL
jgi:hypothetical protein